MMRRAGVAGAAGVGISGALPAPNPDAPSSSSETEEGRHPILKAVSNQDVCKTYVGR